MRRSPWILLFAAIILGSACAELPQVQGGECGNHVLEKGEDCDWFGRDGFDCRRADVSLGGCRLECKSDGTCPKGYGCGADLICRRPSGTFDYDPKTAVHIAGFVRRVKLGDFDHDGRADVVGETLTDLRVHFFDGKGPPARSVVLQGSGPIAVGQLTEDGLSSVAVGSSDTLSVWRGQPDRSLSTVLYPTLPIPTSGDLRVFVADGLSSKAGLAFLGDELFLAQGAASTTFFPAKQDPSSQVTLFTVPRTMGEIVGPAIGRFQNFPQCDGIVYGLNKDNKVYASSICASDNLWSQNAQPRVITASDTLDATTSRLVAGRVNGDALQDLLIQNASGVEVAYAVGDGSFDSSPLVFSNGNGLTQKYLRYLPKDRTPRVLAVGDLDGDLQGDVIDTAGIWLTSINGYAYGAALSAATVMDLNGDKRNDVIATTALGTLFLFGTASKFLNPAFYALDAIPEKMTIADFDGDQLPDVLVATKTDSATDSLWVQWSRSAQFPEAPAFVGKVPTVVTMASGRLTPFLVSGSGGQSVLASTAMAPILVRRARDGQLQAPLLVGDASRVLTSPFLLSKQTPSGAVGLGEMASLVIGNFDGTGHPGFAALAFDIGSASLEAPRLWHVPSQGEAELDPVSVVRTEEMLPIGRVQNDAMLRSWQEPLVAAVDLDRDGADELLTLAPPDLLPLLPIPTTGRLFVSKVGAKGFETTGIDVGAAGALFAVSRGWGLRVADVDGDGFGDVLVMFMDANKHPQLRVMLNDGQGTLDPARLLEVPMPLLGAVEIATDFTTVRTESTSARRSIALLTSQKLWLIPWSQSASSFAAPIAQGTSTQLTGGRSIAAADVDGDGVEDLVIADAQGLALYFGKELAP